MAKEGESDLPWRLTPETLGAATQPLLLYECFVLSCDGIYWWLACKLRRDFDHRFTDKHRYRIQIARIAFESEALCFERQCAAARKGVMKAREFFSKAAHQIHQEFRDRRVVLNCPDIVQLPISLCAREHADALCRQTPPFDTGLV